MTRVRNATAQSSALFAEAEKMRRRTPGMMSDPVEAARRIDLREGVRSRQLSRRDRGEDRGAMRRAASASSAVAAPSAFGERRAHFGRNAPADRLCAAAERRLSGDRFARPSASSARPVCRVRPRGDRQGLRSAPWGGRRLPEAPRGGRRDRARAACSSYVAAPPPFPAAPPIRTGSPAPSPAPRRRWRRQARRVRSRPKAKRRRRPPSC